MYRRDGVRRLSVVRVILYFAEEKRNATTYTRKSIVVGTGTPKRPKPPDLSALKRWFSGLKR